MQVIIIADRIFSYVRWRSFSLVGSRIPRLGIVSGPSHACSWFWFGFGPSVMLLVMFTSGASDMVGRASCSYSCALSVALLWWCDAGLNAAVYVYRNRTCIPTLYMYIIHLPIR